MMIAEDKLYLTAGTKFEYQTYSNLQVQPTLRLLYLPSKRASCWASVSRAARSPSEAEASLMSTYPISAVPPTLLTVSGNPNLKASSLVAFELGYRAQPADDFSWDVATFYNVYQNLIGAGALSPTVIPPNLILASMTENNLHGDSYGAEISATWQVDEKWRLYGAYTLLFVNVSGFQDFENTARQDSFSAPNNQFYLQSSYTLATDVKCDLIGRFIGPVEAYNVHAYAALDARISWQVKKNVQVAIVGQNLSEGNHFEYGSATLQATQVPRTAYGMITYSR
jgi:iron complex outermembrane receptor protein